MIKLIIIAILAVTTLGLLGATIGLGVTHKSGGSKSTTTPAPQEAPLCNDVNGYVKSFLANEKLTLSYIDFTEAGDAALISSMMGGDPNFTTGKTEFGKQSAILSGAIFASNQLGVDCREPGTISSSITARFDTVDGYSRMTYSEFLESQGIYS